MTESHLYQNILVEYKIIQYWFYWPYIQLKSMQCLMGHRSISSTEVHTKVFALDVAARHRGLFSMPERSRRA
ncbi:hypothetical protein F9V36_23645 [Escherichia coli]|nr:hypothetical protein [Escherichia coli]EFA5104579.1 hypothetical protein [Escherichia coli]EFA5170951.1 hypothetical protein [Escherichia coli]EFC4312418.1 hypothetical protein [Escherichia coli]EFE2061131.1 hypothetical protein [Escherichia coli]